MVCLIILLLWQVPPSNLSSAHEAVEGRNYGRAVQLLDSVIQSDSTRIEARYLRGVALREQGRNPTLKTRLQRYLARSAEDFEFVIARDSAYQDVLLQYAILRFYQNDLQHAIVLGEAQLQHRPELEQVSPHLLSFYWRYIITHDPEETRLWLRTQSGLLTSLFIGRAYEQQGMYDAAERVYHESEDAESTLTLLFRARLAFAQMRFEQGTRIVQKAIFNLSDRQDALILFEEIKTIVSPAELLAFERIDDPEEYRDFFNAFWNSRDPMPAASYNARMAEHYRRLRIAEQDYLFRGFRSWSRSAFTYEETRFPLTYSFSSDFTDRGIIFIRHGEPDNYTLGNANSWLYNDSRLVFHFAPTCISWICSVTDHFVPVPQGPTFAPLMVGLDPIDMEKISMGFLADGLSTDRHQWSPNIRHWEIPYVVGAFRGIDGQTLVEIYYKVPLHETARVSGPDSVLMETGFAAYTDDWSRKNYLRNRNQYVKGAPAFVDQFQMDLPAAQFNFALHARVLNGVHLQAIRFNYIVPAYSNLGLQLSDIFLADSIDVLPDAELRNEIILYVNPSGEFQQTAAPFVYFEIYNLERAPDGRTRYRIAYTLTPSDEKKSDRIRLQTSEQRGTEASPISYISVDLSEAKSGDYILEAEVEDLISGAVAQTSRALSLN